VKPWQRRLLAFFPAVVLATFLATTASTLSVLLRLRKLDVDVTAADALRAVAHDWVGMGPTYGALIAVGFLVALLVAGALARLLPAARGFLYALAGAAAIATILLSMRTIFEITPIAGARSATGLAVQSLAGAIGTWFFARLTAGGGHANR
jgi:hypothetical protein